MPLNDIPIHDNRGVGLESKGFSFDGSGFETGHSPDLEPQAHLPPLNFELPADDALYFDDLHNPALTGGSQLPMVDSFPGLPLMQNVHLDGTQTPTEAGPQGSYQEMVQTFHFDGRLYLELLSSATNLLGTTTTELYDDNGHLQMMSPSPGSPLTQNAQLEGVPTSAETSTQSSFQPILQSFNILDTTHTTTAGYYNGNDQVEQLPTAMVPLPELPTAQDGQLEDTSTNSEPALQPSFQSQQSRPQHDPTLSNYLPADLNEFQFTVNVHSTLQGHFQPQPLPTTAGYFGVQIRHSFPPHTMAPQSYEHSFQLQPDLATHHTTSTHVSPSVDHHHVHRHHHAHVHHLPNEIDPSLLVPQTIPSPPATPTIQNAAHVETEPVPPNHIRCLIRVRVSDDSEEKKACGHLLPHIRNEITAHLRDHQNNGQLPLCIKDCPFPGDCKSSATESQLSAFSLHIFQKHFPVPAVLPHLCRYCEKKRYKRSDEARRHEKHSCQQAPDDVKAARHRQDKGNAVKKSTKTTKTKAETGRTKKRTRTK